jgi:hypothetical protein
MQKISNGPRHSVFNVVGIFPKDKNLRTQISGKFNDMNSADDSKKNIAIEPLFKNYKKTIILIH